MRVLSSSRNKVGNEEWEVAGLYSAFSFRKARTVKMGKEKEVASHAIQISKEDSEHQNKDIIKPEVKEVVASDSSSAKRNSATLPPE
jgi:hypothetical protein